MLYNNDTTTTQQGQDVPDFDDEEESLPTSGALPSLQALQYQQETEAALVRDPEKLIGHIYPDIQAVFDLRDQAATLSTEDLHEIMLTKRERFVQAAERLQERIIEINTHMRSNLVILGFMLTWGEYMGLYTFAGSGATNPKQWATLMGISPTMREEAIELVKAWPHFQALGYTLHDLADPQFTPPKIKGILRDAQDANRQKKEIQVHLAKEYLRQHDQVTLPSPGEENNDDEESGRSEEEEAEVPTTRKEQQALFSSLPEDVYQQISQQAHDEYQAQARAHIEEVRQMTSEDYLFEKLRSQGIKKAPNIGIWNITYRNGRVYYEGSFDCNLEEAEALGEGRYNIYFALADGSGTTLSPKQLGSFLTDKIGEEENAHSDEYDFE